MLIKNKTVKPKVENPDTQIRHEKGVRNMAIEDTIRKDLLRRKNQEIFHVFGFKNNVQFCEHKGKTLEEAKQRMEQLKLDDRYTELGITVS